MFIENPECLKSWLEAYLTPKCDADPQVLAKYCLALVRKDRPDDELKASMLEQLDVFLKEHTTPFVEEFLIVAKNKSYLPKPVKVPVKSPTSSPQLKETSPDSTSQTMLSGHVPATETINPPLPLTAPESAPKPPPDSPPPASRKDDARLRKDQEKDDRRIKRRSRSRDRSRRSRSRGRSSKSDRRRRSPHSKRYRRSRSRSRSRSPLASHSKDRHSSSPSTKSRGGRHITRSKSPIANTNNAVKSPEKEKEDINVDKKDGDKTLSSVISVPPPAAGSSYGKSQRCRDYDEEGFCMRGDQCPYDHGSDPVVLEGASLDFPPPITGNSNSSLSPYSVPPPPTQGSRTVVTSMPPQSRGSSFNEYTPNNPSLWVEDAEARNSAPAIPSRFTVPPPDLGRELISLTADQAKQGLSTSMAKRLGPPKFNNGIYKPRFGQADNNTLELRKIPPELNNITQLNNHFCKFGNVTNIQVRHEGEADAALIAFSSHAEANAAYRSAEAVLNNRFIKLFWHNASKENSQKQMQNRSHPYGYQRPHEGFPGKRDKVVQSRGTIVKTVYSNPVDQDIENKDSAHAVPDSTQPAGASAEEIRKIEIETICKQQELLKAELAAKQKLEKKKLESIKLKQDLEQRTRQLHQKQMEQVKILIAKLEANKKNMKPEEIKSLMNTIKLLQDSTSSTKAKLASVKSAPVVAPVRSKVQLDKEILDTELELYNVQSDNQDIGRLRGRLQQLKTQMATMKASQTYAKHAAQRGLPTRGHPMGGRMRGRGRGRPANIVDRRTTCINASGFEREDKEEVLAHFAGFGSLTNYTWDDQTPSITVQYGSRREAEKALVDGRNLADRLLTLTWSRALEPKDASQEPGTPRRNSTAKSESDQTTEDTEEITEEIVEIVETVDGDDDSVIFEDEEEEQEEARSWRR